MWLSAAAFVAGAAGCYVGFRNLDAGEVYTVLARIGIGWLWVLVPMATGLALETSGWRLVFGWLGRRVAFWPLFTIRLATESVSRTLPAGIVWCESIKPALLKHKLGVPGREAIAAMVARKHLVLWSHAAYLALAAFVAAPYLRAASHRMGSVIGLHWVTAASAVSLMLVALSWSMLFRHGELVTRALSLVRRLVTKKLQLAFERHSMAARQADAAMTRVLAPPLASQIVAVLACLGGWLMEAAETWVILELVGAHVSPAAVLGMEVLVSLVRNVLVIVPAGIGIQDVGYVIGLSWLGVSEPVVIGAAMAAIKRVKDLFWAAAGYAWLLDSLRSRPLTPGDRAISAPRSSASAA